MCGGLRRNTSPLVVNGDCEWWTQQVFKIRNTNIPNDWSIQCFIIWVQVRKNMIAWRSGGSCNKLTKGWWTCTCTLIEQLQGALLGLAHALKLKTVADNAHTFPRTPSFVQTRFFKRFDHDTWPVEWWNTCVMKKKSNRTQYTSYPCMQEKF